MRELKRTRIEDLAEFLMSFRKMNYIGSLTELFELKYTDDNMELEEGIYISENELALSLKTSGYTEVWTNIEEKQIIDIVLDNFNIEYYWSTNNTFIIRLYKSEIKEFLMNYMDFSDSYKQMDGKDVLRQLQGDISTKDISISLTKEPNSKKNFVLVMWHNKKKVPLEIELIRNTTQLLVFDEYIQQKYNIPSYIRGVCQVNGLNYQQFLNLRNNIIMKLICQ